MPNKKFFMLPLLCGTLLFSASPIKNSFLKENQSVGAANYDCDTYDYGTYTSGIYSYNNDFRKAYFDNLTNNFGYNTSGSCGYVAIGMVLSYYDTIWNDEIIPEKYDVPCYSDDTDFLSKRNSPGIKGNSHGGENDFEEMLISKAPTTNLSKPNTWHIDRRLILNYYLQEEVGLSSNQYELLESYEGEVVVESNTGGIKSPTPIPRQNAIEWVKQGYPVIISMGKYDGGHVVVAYEYDEENDKLYAHWGHSGSTHVCVEDEMARQGWFISSAIAIDFDEELYPKIPATNNYVCASASYVSGFRTFKMDYEYYSYDDENINTCGDVEEPQLYIENDGKINISNRCDFVYLSNTLFKGNYSPRYVFENIHLEIENRQNGLILFFDNFKATNGTNPNDLIDGFISYKGSDIFILTIVYTGDNVFNYASGYTRNLYNDVPAIDLFNVNVKFFGLGPVCSFSAYGANGTKGTNGINGSDSAIKRMGGIGACGCAAVLSNVIDFADAPYLKLVGGNGGLGGNGGNGANSSNGYGKDGGNGGPGGYGGLPFMSNVIFSTNLGYAGSKTDCLESIKFEVGLGGRGGYGGNGGNGIIPGYGGKGGTCAENANYGSRYSYYFPNITKGGNGKDGSDGKMLPGRIGGGKDLVIRNSNFDLRPF